jgi:transcriptional regulator with XRE-family HTH domain
MEHHILIDAREKLALTQQQAADKADITLRQYQRFESGERNLSSSSLNIAHRVLRALDLNVDAYMNGDYVFSEETVELPGVDEYLTQIRKEKSASFGVFKDKICVFIGKLERCSRTEAQDILFDVGGVSQNNLAAFVNFAIVGKGAEHTNVFKEAKSWAQKGFCTLITEQEFFDAIDGKFTPSENPNKATNVVVIPADEASAPSIGALIEMKRSEYLSSRRIITKGGYLKVPSKETIAEKDEVQSNAE